MKDFPLSNNNNNNNNNNNKRERRMAGRIKSCHLWASATPDGRGLGSRHKLRGENSRTEEKLECTWTGSSPQFLVETSSRLTWVRSFKLSLTMRKIILPGFLKGRHRWFRSPDNFYQWQPVPHYLLKHHVHMFHVLPTCPNRPTSRRI